MDSNKPTDSTVTPQEGAPVAPPAASEAAPAAETTATTTPAETTPAASTEPSTTATPVAEDTTSATPASTPTTDAAAPAAATVVTAPAQPKGSMKKWIIIGVSSVIVLALLTAGIYFYLASQKKSEGQPQAQQQAPQASIEPAAQNADLESELNALDTPEDSSDFSAIDEELKTSL